MAILDGDSRKVAAKISAPGVRNADGLKKAFLHCHGGEVYLLSHCRAIADEITADVPRHGMLAVTHLCGASAFESLEMMTTVAKPARGFSVRVFHDPASVAAVHGDDTQRPRRTQAAPADVTPAASSPYMLPGYTSNIYEGFASYHASHRVTMNTPTNGYRGHRIGVELEVEFDDAASKRTFTDEPRNWYFCEHDSSLDDYGCEIVTIPLLPGDAKSRDNWKRITDRLTELGATSWDNGNCGLHVHIGREILGDPPKNARTTSPK